MVLADVDSTIIWSTGTTSASVDEAQLLDTGNLVVKDSKGNILWQSFDSPTDTLLPLQPITRSKQLVSRIGKGSVASGYYSFYFDNDNVLKLMYNGPEVTSIYWPNPDYNVWQDGRSNYNSSRYGVLDEEGNFFASDELEFSSSDMGYGIRRRLSLDSDGNLRLYSFNESNRTWLVSWEALPQPCQVHGLCGRNGICVYVPKPGCSCPPGYEMSDTSDWNRGCKRKFNISCDGNQQLEFVELPSTDFWGFDLNYTSPLALVDCMKLCEEDCACEAIGYKTGPGDCFTKSALFNGKTSPQFPGSTYLKVPRIVKSSRTSVSQVRQPICSGLEDEGAVSYLGYVRRRDKSKWIDFYWFIAAFGLIEIIFIVSGWWFMLRRDDSPASLEEGYKVISSQFRKFSYRELRRATRKFEEELGRGGSGAVYKGLLDDSRVVAIKKLEDVIQGEEEFWAEVNVIGRIYHMNLVRMWGFCSERSHKLLVYEFVENGSLDKHLFDEHSNSGLLSWKERFRVAVGVAKGLAYLHHECLEWVIHCDVKPENILLDFDYEPKISDFGLAKLSKRGGSNSSFSQVRGTRGYMAPEWALNLPITAKVDVYSYGVILLEILKGSRVSSEVVNEEEGVKVGLVELLGSLKEKIRSGQESWVGGFVDSRLDGKFSFRQAMVLVEMAVCCLEEESSKRPDMDSVVQMLLSCDDEHNSVEANIMQDGAGNL